MPPPRDTNTDGDMIHETGRGGGLGSEEDFHSFAYRN